MESTAGQLGSSSGCGEDAGPRDLEKEGHIRLCSVSFARPPGGTAGLPVPTHLTLGVVAALPSAQASVLPAGGTVGREPLVLRLGCRQHPGLG